MEGEKKKQHTQACLLFLVKTERTANQLHISMEPDHDSNPTALGKKEWNKTKQSLCNVGTIALYLTTYLNVAIKKKKADLTCSMRTVCVCLIVQQSTHKEQSALMHPSC